MRFLLYISEIKSKQMEILIFSSQEDTRNFFSRVSKDIYLLYVIKLIVIVKVKYRQVW